jgi:hypothetical protein
MPDQPNSPERPVTPTLGEVVRRREDLFQAIIGLERAAARPAAAREGQWRASVIEAIERLEDEIAAHIEITERPDGLYDEIVEHAPRLSHDIDALRAEHPEMRDSAAALKARLLMPEVPSVVDVRDDVRHLLARLSKHRQHGADLVWEAYSVDTGGSD